MKTVLVAIMQNIFIPIWRFTVCVLMQEPLDMNRSYWNLQLTSKKTRF